jgi:hypothetical protein
MRLPYCRRFGATACGLVHQIVEPPLCSFFIFLHDRPGRPLTVVQDCAVRDIISAVRAAGAPPCGMTDETALSEMLASKTAYSAEPANLAPFSLDKLKVVHTRLRPQPLEHLLPEHAKVLLKDFTSYIERTAPDIADRQNDLNMKPIKPYWDPVLRSCRKQRLQFIKILVQTGLIGFRKAIKSKVGIFFVKKKDPKFIRMIIDARLTNWCHRRPPVTRLGAGSCYVDLDLSDEALFDTVTGVGALPSTDFTGGHMHDETSTGGFGNEADVQDCFYNYSMPSLASWFGIDEPLTVLEWRSVGISIQSYFDDNLQKEVPVHDHLVLYPCVEALSMGWSWALYFANEAVAYAVGKSAVARHSDVREKLPMPQLFSFPTLTGTYVDNVAIVGLKMFFDRAAVPSR